MHRGNEWKKCIQLASISEGYNRNGLHLLFLYSPFPVFSYLPLLFKYEKNMLSLEAQCYVQLLQVQGLPFRKSSFSSTRHCLIPCNQLRILASQKEESRCSLGIPDTSFKGLRTRTARRVRRSTWVLKWVPAVARMLWIETRKTQGYHSLSVPSCFMGSLGL